MHCSAPGDPLPGINWPAPVSSDGARLLALQFQLDRSQWLSPPAIRAMQQRQLHDLLTHAADTSPFYCERVGPVPLNFSADEFWTAWREIPLLTRTDVQQHVDDIISKALPKSHGRLRPQYTTGSSGSPVMVMATDVTSLVWNALTLREHLWHRRDPREKLAVIRATRPGKASPPEGETLKSWGPPVSLVTRTGPSAVLSIFSTADEQAQFLQRQNPVYVLSYPSVFVELAERRAAGALSLPRLKQLRTFGELLEPTARQRIEGAFDVPVVDTYSCQEVGCIAFQCPDSGMYHVQTESVLLEVLDDSGQPVSDGEIGRIIVTPLYNFASPLVRYELGDYAEVAPPCSCGRGLPTLRRIIGRQRQMIRLPNGKRRWFMPIPDEDAATVLASLPPIRQFQIIQHSLTDVDAKFVTPRPLSGEEQTRLRAYVRRILGHPFEVSLDFVGAIPRGPGGKFEEFRCEVGAAS